MSTYLNSGWPAARKAQMVPQVVSGSTAPGTGDRSGYARAFAIRDVGRRSAATRTSRPDGGCDRSVGERKVICHALLPVAIKSGLRAALLILDTRY